MTRSLTISCVGLTHAEATLIQTILKLSSNPYVRQWRWVNSVDEAPLAAVLLGEHVEATTLSMEEMNAITQASARLCIGQPHSPLDMAHDIMPRPIRAECLLDWLARKTPGYVEKPSAGNGEPPQRSAPIVAGLGHSDIRLTRWPSTVFLRGDATRIRLSALLSKRSMSIAKLSVVSGESMKTCDDFAHELQTANLLEVRPRAHHDIASATAVSHPHAVMAAANASFAPIKTRQGSMVPQTSKPAAALGFFQNLRRHLGL